MVESWTVLNGIKHSRCCCGGANVGSDRRSCVLECNVSSSLLTPRTVDNKAPLLVCYGSDYLFVSTETRSIDLTFSLQMLQIVQTGISELFVVGWRSMVFMCLILKSLTSLAVNEHECLL